MKRTSVKTKLKQRLALVRTTVRELTPGQLEQVNGGDGGKVVLGNTNCDCRASM
jgi:hypothetical protein